MATLDVNQDWINLSSGSNRSTPKTPGTESLQVVDIVTQLMMRISYETKPYLLRSNIPETEGQEFYIRHHFLSEKELGKRDEKLALLVMKVCRFVAQQFEFEDETHIVHEVDKSGHVCILKDSLDIIEEVFEQLKSKGNKPAAAVLDPAIDWEKSIGTFVAQFNMHFRLRELYRREAIQRLKALKLDGWEYAGGCKTVPKPEAVPHMRDAFFRMYLCNDAEIKERALNDLIEVMECDPFTMNSAYNLVDLQKKLLIEINTSNAQNLPTSIQRLLTKAYSITLECILIHNSMDHLNALTNDLKDEIWSGADDLSGLNIVDDEEIFFWTEYAIQGAQHLKTDKHEIIEWIERISLIVQAAIRIASAINRPEEGGAALEDAYDNIIQAFYHVRWRKDWFKRLLLLKKLARYFIHDVSGFRKVSEMVQKMKRETSGNKLFYGAVSIFEYVISKTTKQEIQEEGLKLLLQYGSVEKSFIQNRVISAFIQILKLNEKGGKLQNTAFACLRLLGAQDNTTSAVIETSIATLPRTVRSRIKQQKEEFERSGGNLNDYLFVNVIKFMLKREAEIKQEEDLGGHSFVTLLSSSNEDKVVPGLLRVLKMLSSRFIEPDIYGRTAYHISVKKRNPSMLCYLRSGMPEIDINYADYQRGDTAMHYAARAGDTDLVLLLMELGGDPDKQNAQGNTALHLATMSGNPRLAAKLLSKKADPNQVNCNGETPMNIAISQDDEGFVKLLQRYGGKISERVNQCSPFIIAAQEKSERVLMYLINRQLGFLSKLEALEVLRMISKDQTALHCSQVFAKYHVKMMEKNQHYRNAFKPYCLWPKISIVDDTAVLDSEASCTRCKAFGNTALIQAALEPERFDELVDLIQSKADLNQANFLGITPLHAAVLGGNRRAVEALLKKGALPSHGDARGNTPLHFAAYMGNTEIVKLLLAKGAKPNMRNDFGDTPLLISVGNDPERVPSTVESVVAESMAAACECSIIAHELIKADANPFIADVQDNNLLHHALMFGNREVIHYVSKHFPDLFWKTNAEGLIPIQKAVRTGKRDAIHALLEHLTPGELLHLHQAIEENKKIRDTLGNLLAESNNVEMFKRLLSVDKKVAFHPDHRSVKETPLHVAARMNHLDFLRIYLREDLPIDYRDGFGNTPLHVAAIRGSTKFFDLLEREKKLDLFVKNFDQRTPLHLATIKNNDRICERILLKHPELAQEKDGHGDTPLHLASRYEHATLLKKLLDLYPEAINVSNDEGNTPLHLAAASGRLWAVSQLILKEADTEARNIYGETPFLLAAQGGHLGLVGLLHKCKADFWAQDDEKESALHKAVFNLHVDVVEKLLEIDQRNRLVRMQDIRKEIPLHELAKIKVTKPGQVGARMRILQLLLEAGSDPSHKNEQGETFLHTICSYGAEGLLEIVYQWSVAIKEKVNFATTDDHGNTILHMAAEHNQRQMVESILDMYVNLHARNDEGVNALHIAVMNGFIPLAHDLVRFGAHLRSKDQQGRTILHLLFSHKKMTPMMLNFLRTMLIKDPKLAYIRDYSKESCLHVLARNNHLEALDILLRNLPGKQKHRVGFLWKTNDEDHTAYDVAKDQGYKEMRYRIQNYKESELGTDLDERMRIDQQQR